MLDCVLIVLKITTLNLIIIIIIIKKKVDQLVTTTIQTFYKVQFPKRSVLKDTEHILSEILNSFITVHIKPLRYKYPVHWE
jgi:hypothetical protein